MQQARWQEAGWSSAAARLRARGEREAKRAVVDAALRALGATFELVSERSPALAEEIRPWEEGRTVELAVLPSGPAIRLAKRGERIRYLGCGRPSRGTGGAGSPTVSLRFKNLQAAFVTFTGQMAAHTASIEHRVVIHGNVAHAMQANRALAIVQQHLLPALMLNRIAKRPVRLDARDLRVKAAVLARLPGRLATLWARRPEAV